MVKKKEQSLKEKIGDALFSKVSDFFMGAFQMVWKDSKTATDILADSLSNKVKKGISAEGDPEVKKAIIKSLDSLQLSPEAKEALTKELSNTSNSDIAVAVVKVISFTLGGFISMGSEALVPEIQNMRKWIRKTIPDSSLANMANIKNPELQEIVKDIFERSGLDDDMQKVIKESARTTLPPDIIKTLFFRDIIEDKTVDDLLLQNGLNKEDSDRLKKSFEFVPSLQDIITMAVREVFSPAVASKFGQFDDYPPELTKWAKKHGVSEEWAKNYWASHWDLPSISAGYEMLHRDVINEEELDMLLRAKDVMPFWRDKIKLISYSPYTRVDVRRMFTAGIISEEEVKRSYLDQGYDDEHATNLTNWTIQSVIEEEREPTKTDIISGFKLGAITQADTIEMLIDLGYNERAISLIVTKAIHDKDQSLISQRKSALKSSYLRGTYSESEVSQNLSSIGLTPLEVSSLLDSWAIQKLELEPDAEEIESRSINKSEIISLYKSESINKSETKGLLQNLNYASSDIDLLFAKADFDSSKKIKTQRVNAVRKTYLKGIFSDNEVIERLKTFELEEKEIQSLINVWDIERLEVDPSNIIEHERGVTKADLIASFKRDLLTIEELKNGLLDLNYNEFVVDVLTARANYDKTKSLQDKIISSINKGYVKGIYTESETRNKLLALNLDGSEVDNYFTWWNVERLDNEPTLSVTSYAKAFKLNIITEEFFKVKLELKGFSDENVNILLKLAGAGQEIKINE